MQQQGFGKQSHIFLTLFMGYNLSVCVEYIRSMRKTIPNRKPIETTERYITLDKLTVLTSTRD